MDDGQTEVVANKGGQVQGSYPFKGSGGLWGVFEKEYKNYPGYGRWTCAKAKEEREGLRKSRT